MSIPYKNFVKYFTIIFLIKSVENIPSSLSLPTILPKCYHRLDNALENILKKSQSRSQSRSFIDLSSHTIRQPIRHQYPLEWSTNRNEDSDHQDFQSALYGKMQISTADRGGTLQPNAVEVSNVKFRIPKNMKWVRIEKCQMILSNKTLDTRLLFPDLTIYGRVTLRPLGGHCDMILRLRRVSLDFQTTILPPNEISDKLNARSFNVKTDSYFSESGFMSIFAHGCEGPTDIKFRRINSKIRNFHPTSPSAPSYQLKDILPSETSNHQRRRYWLQPSINDRIEHRSQKDIDSIMDNEEPQQKTFSSTIFGHPRQQNNQHWQYLQQSETSEEIANAFLRELEHLFSKGVQGILTSYIQKMLQPAIKNTLMEGMGFTLSYG